MKHIKLFENFLNESDNYDTLGDLVPFELVIEFLEESKSSNSIALLGYNDDNDKFINIPLEGIKFDDDLEYIACLMKINSKSKLDPESIQNQIQKNVKSLHSYVHLNFDSDGKMYGADRYGANDVSWFIDEFGMVSEHDDEYQEYFDELDGEDEDDY